jgi:hypothetical protein
MMEDVSEQEWHTGPPALRPEAGVARPQPGQPVPAPREPGPPPIDPAAVRQYQQFQQFQQFQELVRQHGEDAAPLLLRPAPKPLWKRVLGSRLVRRLVLLALVLAALSWAYNYYFGSDNENLPASMTGGGTYRTNRILSTNPYEAVRKVYQRVADNTPEQACGVFIEQAQREFARNWGAADCAAAVAKLNAEVDKAPGSKNAYAEPDFHGKMGGVPIANTITISSCELGVTAGPRLGAFTLSRVEQNQWIITGHRLESC